MIVQPCDNILLAHSSLVETVEKYNLLSIPSYADAKDTYHACR
jgi:hypothetical protein